MTTLNLPRQTPGKCVKCSRKACPIYPTRGLLNSMCFTKTVSRLGYRLDNWGRGSDGTFSLCHCVQPNQTPIQRILGGLTLGVKWLEHEAHHSPPSSAKVKTVWSYTSPPQYAFTKQQMSSWYGA